MLFVDAGSHVSRVKLTMGFGFTMSQSDAQLHDPSRIVHHPGNNTPFACLFRCEECLHLPASLVLHAREGWQHLRVWCSKLQRLRTRPSRHTASCPSAASSRTPTWRSPPSGAKPPTPPPADHLHIFQCAVFPAKPVPPRLPPSSCETLLNRWRRLQQRLVFLTCRENWPITNDVEPAARIFPCFRGPLASLTRQKKHLRTATRPDFLGAHAQSRVTARPPHTSCALHCPTTAPSIANRSTARN